MKSKKWIIKELSFVIEQYEKYVVYVDYDPKDYEKIVSAGTKEKLVEFWVTIIRLAEILDLVNYTHQVDKRKMANEVIDLIKLGYQEQLKQSDIDS